MLDEPFGAEQHFTLRTGGAWEPAAPSVRPQRRLEGRPNVGTVGGRIPMTSCVHRYPDAGHLGGSQQADAWSAPVGISSRRAARQARVHREGQRGWNPHPLGRLIRLGGEPTIGSNRLPITPVARERDRASPGCTGDEGEEDAPDALLAPRPTRIHHEHVIGDRRDHPEIVRDDDHRHTEFLLHLHQQLHQLRLHRRVERRRRLVGDEQLGLEGQRHRDHHALSHASRHLVGISSAPGVGLRYVRRVGVSSLPIHRFVLADAGVGADRLSTICQPTRKCGWRLDSGS